MTESNLNIVLSNVICCLAQKGYDISNMYSVGNKCADEELLKLKIIQDKFESLRCYNFDIVDNSSLSDAVFVIHLTNLNSSLFEYTLGELDPYTIIVNGVTYSGIGNNTFSMKSKLEELLGITQATTKFCGEVTGCTYTFYTNCINTDASYSYLYKGEVLNSGTLYLQTPGVCNGIVTERKNCLTPEDMDKLAHDLMEECDICDCQLNQE